MNDQLKLEVCLMVTEAGAAERLVRLPEVIRRTGISRSHIHKMISQGNFPASIRLSHKVAVWREADIAAWISRVLEAAA